ncbi:galectin-8 isoform X3 [Ailuropoda melanoleuca]|uniref:Galectin n=1 Tax=Ailuropoda melanoleuca TaxID=9646 RepID=A0A7N5P8X4_AILME|nr:galectin-8 isoform X3 [Ailuropoda melanoleuca]
MLSLTNLQNVIYNPVLPYVGTIPGQLEPGTLIVIRGHVPCDSDRFQVDLQCGSSVKPRADVAFHFNPRFKWSDCIVCNTLKNEKWGWEEITYDVPFKKEKSFEIVIMVLKDKFQVAVNGKHILLYAHRISPGKIDTLGIYGKVNVHSVGYSFSSDFRSTQASTLELTEISKENVVKSDTSHFTLPFTARLNSPMGPGRTVFIKGEVNKTAKGFNVNLVSGKSKDIALHLNPRLNSKAFVRNSFLHESWGEEERNITCFPFSPGMYFEMIIYCDAREFKVAVNGVHSVEYKHRFKELSAIDTLEIDGDVHLLEPLVHMTPEIRKLQSFEENLTLSHTSNSWITTSGNVITSSPGGAMPPTVSGPFLFVGSAYTAHCLSPPKKD